MRHIETGRVREREISLDLTSASTYTDAYANERFETGAVTNPRLESDTRNVWTFPDVNRRYLDVVDLSRYHGTVIDLKLVATIMSNE